MKTTIALSLGTRLVVEPSAIGGGVVRFRVQTREGRQEGQWRDSEDLPMTQDQAGALIFGLETAALAAELAVEAREARARNA